MNNQSLLGDVRVLGVTVFLAGPYTLLNLARLGAEVTGIDAVEKNIKNLTIICLLDLLKGLKV